MHMLIFVLNGLTSAPPYASANQAEQPLISDNFCDFLDSLKKSYYLCAKESSALRSSSVIPLARKGLGCVHRIVKGTA